MIKYGEMYFMFKGNEYAIPLFESEKGWVTYLVPDDNGELILDQGLNDWRWRSDTIVGIGILDEGEIYKIIKYMFTEMPKWV